MCFTVETCSYTAHLVRTLAFDSNLVFPHLSEEHFLRQLLYNAAEVVDLPEITASLMLPCSSLAIRSASSINNVPKP